MGNGPYVASPEEQLANLMADDLGVTIAPRELRMFIRANWRKVSAYAHAIHGTEGQRQTPEGCPSNDPKRDREGY
jgi:hypothetical protein